jgi:hypothetical protein
MTHIHCTRRSFLKTSFGIASAGATSHFWGRLCEGGEANRDCLPWVPGSWTLVVLPDTQRYTDTRWDKDLVIFRTMTQWIADNKKARNIVFVLHEGDITSGNTASVTPPNTVAAWQAASDAMAILDEASIPYSLTTGNHDHDRWNPFRNSPSRDTFLNDFFPVSRYKSMSTFGGVFEPGKTENNYHVFSVGGTDYVTVALEWGPRDEAIAWADGVLTEHANRTALIVTHAYTYEDGTRYDWATKGTHQKLNPHCKSYGFSAPHDGSENVNDGEQLWQKLISKHANVRMVFSGHLNNGARQTSVGQYGQRVHEMMAAYHDPPEGYLRLLEFLPHGTTVQVRTYSPYLNRSLTDGNNQFPLEVEPARDPDNAT